MSRRQLIAQQLHAHNRLPVKTLPFKKRKNPMLYCKSSIVRVTALLLALTASSLFSSSALATTFNLSTLNGAYGGQVLFWQSVGSAASPAILPTSIRELITFDGAGNFTIPTPTPCPQ
jgi:hypothetical protein